MVDAPALVEFTAHPADPSGSDAPWWIQETFSTGTQFTAGVHSTWVYSPGGAIERVIGSFRPTRTDASFIAVVAAPDPGITVEAEWGPADQWTWDNDAQRDFDVQAGDGAWVAGTRYAPNCYVAWQRQATNVTIGADAAVYWSNLLVIHRRYNYGGGLVDAAAAPALTVQGMIEDLMGRGFNAVVEYDPNRVEPGTPWATAVPHAAWWTGVSAREVLTLGERYAPDMWWEIGEPGVSGLPRFRVGRWNGPARYVLASGDVELSGGAADLANRCLVRYIGSEYKQTKSVWVAEVRANIRGLAEAGIVRTMALDLTGDGLTTPVQARVRAVAALRTAAQAKTAGRAVITGPIYDHVEGRMVEPWEVVGGSPVIVSDAPLSFSRSTSLAESVGADGVSVFRAVTTEYDLSSNSCALGLDGGSRSLVGRLKTDAAPRRYDVQSARV